MTTMPPRDESEATAPAQWPILERGDETAELERLVGGAAAGEGSLLMLEAAAGMGKTTLVRQAATLAASAGLRVLRATGSELESGFPFGIARQLLERPLEEALLAHAEEPLSVAAAVAHRVLGGESAPAEPDTHGPAAVHALYRVITALAAEQPLLVAVDDAHWADVASLRFLHYLARRTADSSIALVIATRPIDVVEAPAPLAALLGSDEARVLRPQLLSADAVAELTRSALGTEPTPQLTEACRQATGGNAFLLTALLSELGREGSETSLEVPAALETLVPDAVRYRVGGWLHSLPAAAIAVARSLAVLGEAKLPLLARHAGVDIDAAGDACARLERIGVVESADTVRFTHPIVGTVVRGSIPAGERSSAHRRAAELLGEEEAPLDARAVHLLATRPEADAWTAEVLHEAAISALARGAPAEAAGYLRRALEEPAAPELRPTLVLELGTALVRMSEYAEAQRVLRRAFDAGPPAELRSRMATAMSQAYFLGGDPDSAIDVLERARREEPDSARVLALDGNAISLGLLDSRRAAFTRARLGEYRARAQRGELSEPSLLAMAGAQAILAAEPRDGAVELIRRAFANGLSAFGDHTFAFGWTMPALDAADLASEALVALDAALAEARPRADVAITSYLLSYRVHLTFRVGRLAEAAADGRAGVQLVGLDEGATFPVGLIDVLLERDGVDEAAALCEQLEQSRGGTEQRSAMVELVRARVEVAFGHDEQALDRLLRAGATLDAMQLLHPQFAPWRAIAAPAADRLGDPELALRLASEALELARRSEAPTAIAQGLRILGGLRGDLAALAESVRAAAQTPDRLEYARSLTELGGAQAAAGQQAQARETLRDALACAHEAGALTLAETARRRLVAAGGRPRRAALRGVEALTPSELQVARLARDGLSNRDISDSLFVSLKMVEQHLARTYAKLGIAGRRELPRALES
jgi:DNA-binding CsgD family transcriptional regulator